MQLDITEITIQLATVNAAIQQLMEGKRIHELRVGSGTFQRLYVYSEVTLDSLMALRRELLEMLQDLEEALPRFRINSTIPLLVSKDIF